MEDTEDWRPRPGTGQSRSFRILAHLTGTEFSKCQPREGRTLLLVPSPDPGLAGAWLWHPLPGLRAGVAFCLLLVKVCLCPLSARPG